MKTSLFLAIALALGACKSTEPTNNESQAQDIVTNAPTGATIFTINHMHAIKKNLADTLFQLHQKDVCFANFNTPDNTLATGLYFCNLQQINSNNAVVLDTIIDTWSLNQDQIILVKDGVQIGRAQWTMTDPKTKTSQWVLTDICSGNEFGSRCDIGYDHWKDSFTFTMKISTNFADWKYTVEKDITSFGKVEKNIDQTYLNGIKLCLAKVQHPGGWVIAMFNCADRANLNPDNFLALDMIGRPTADGLFKSLPLSYQGKEIGLLISSMGKIQIFNLCPPRKNSAGQKCQIHYENGRLSIEAPVAPAAVQ